MGVPHPRDNNVRSQWGKKNFVLKRVFDSFAKSHILSSYIFSNPQQSAHLHDISQDHLFTLDFNVAKTPQTAKDAPSWWTKIVCHISKLFCDLYLLTPARFPRTWLPCLFRVHPPSWFSFSNAFQNISTNQKVVSGNLALHITLCLKYKCYTANVCINVTFPCTCTCSLPWL